MLIDLPQFVRNKFLPILFKAYFSRRSYVLNRAELPNKTIPGSGLTASDIFNDIVYFTPVGICFMVTSSVTDRTNIESDFIQLGVFAATVIGAILIHLILHVLVLSVVSRRNPLRLFKYSFNSFLITFATTSTAASMGEMYNELDRYGCNKLASRFVLFVCLVIKGDGPAIFISAVCIFVVQQTGFEIDFSKVIFIVQRNKERSSDCGLCTPGGEELENVQDISTLPYEYGDK
ncbi:unnamed protein product, partial [Hymenolepis diminuta]|uniref:Amino acid transporter n=1 Tax=Hymenolepis diminuta TaxID=6216 RepID=A0A0R3SYP6_HYMDI